MARALRSRLDRAHDGPTNPLSPGRDRSDQAAWQKAFVLASGNLGAHDQARRFIDNQAAIEAACLDLGPFVYAVRSDGIVRIFPA